MWRQKAKPKTTTPILNKKTAPIPHISVQFEGVDVAAKSKKTMKGKRKTSKEYFIANQKLRSVCS